MSDDISKSTVVDTSKPGAQTSPPRVFRDKAEPPQSSSPKMSTPQVKTPKSETDRLRTQLSQLETALSESLEAERAVRDNAAKILAEKKTLETQVKALGMPLERAGEMLMGFADLPEAERGAGADINAIIGARIEAFKASDLAPIIADRDTWQNKYAALKTAFETEALTGPLMAAWEGAGGKLSKFKYAEPEARSLFRLSDEGAVVAAGEETEDAVSPSMWAADFLMREPDFKRENIGTNAHGQLGRPSGAHGNPWAANYNGADKYGLRLKIAREAAHEAERLKREAAG